MKDMMNIKLNFIFDMFLVFFSHSVVLTICSPMECNTSGFPVLHHLLEFAQIKH